MCTVHPLEVHQKMNKEGMETTRGGRKREDVLSKHNFNLKQVCTKVKHVHLICLFLRKRKPVSHDVDASRALLASLFSGSALNMNPNILLLLLPLDGQNKNMRGKKQNAVYFLSNYIRLYRFSGLLRSGRNWELLLMTRKGKQLKRIHRSLCFCGSWKARSLPRDNNMLREEL